MPRSACVGNRRRRFLRRPSARNATPPLTRPNGATTRPSSDMRPTSIVTRRQQAEDRARTRYQENLRQAGLVASATDDVILDAINSSVAEGNASYEDANDLVLRVRRDQAGREARAA